MSIITVKVPDLSGAEDVDVIEVLVKPGDSVAEGDSLIAVETDKASMEVPAEQSGTVVEVMIEEGGVCNEGDVIISLSTDAGASTEQEENVSEAAPEASPEPEATQAEPAADAVDAPADSAEVSSEQVFVPELSGAQDVDVIEVMVKVGDQIEEGDGLIALETDKASMEVPAPKGGVVTEVNITEGGTCNEGDLILVLEVAGAAPKAAVEKVVEPESTASKPAPVAESSANSAAKESKSSAAPASNVSVASSLSDEDLEKKNRAAYAGPAVRSVAREFGVDLSMVKGTGRKNRILKEDVQTYVKSALQQLKQAPKGLTSGSGIPAIPEIDFSKFGEVEVEKLSKIAKLTRDNMSRCWLNIPHVTQFDEADITDLEAFRKEIKDEAAKEGVKLTPLPFLIKAVAKALAANPKFNASLHADGEHLVYKKYINIGLAVDTPSGLMVPVIKDADKKSLYELSKEAVELAGKAKDRKLKPNEMQGACFTISSLGGIGGTGFTPIVNAPEVGILGVSKADIKPRWNGKEFEPRKMLPLCLSYDHRAINGGDAGRFLTYLNSLLSDIRRLTL